MGGVLSGLGEACVRGEEEGGAVNVEEMCAWRQWMREWCVKGG